MNIDEQITSAWKRELPKVRESLQCSRASQVLGAAEIGFAAGYRAGLRSLYVEVKPEDLGNKYHDHIWVRLKDGVWHESSGINGGFVYLLRAETDGYIYRSWTEKRPADEVDLVVGLADLPSPSDLFTEGRV